MATPSSSRSASESSPRSPPKNAYGSVRGAGAGAAAPGEHALVFADVLEAVGGGSASGASGGAEAASDAVLSARVLRDKISRKSRGYGFVSFKDPTDFMAAMREMNGKYIGNRPVKLRKSSWQDRDANEHKDKLKEVMSTHSKWKKTA